MKSKYPPTATDQEISELNSLKGSLSDDFEAAFGKEAMSKYYLGNPAEPENVDEDRFHHEALAETYQIQLVFFHGKILKPAFMAQALYQHTGNKLYRDLREDLMSDFTAEAPYRRITPKPGEDQVQLTDESFEEIGTELDRAVDIMIDDLHLDNAA